MIVFYNADTRLVADVTNSDGLYICERTIQKNNNKKYFACDNKYVYADSNSKDELIKVVDEITKSINFAKEMGTNLRIGYSDGDIAQNYFVETDELKNMLINNYRD